MLEHRATDGPYLRWLKYAEKKVGPRAWALIAGLDPKSADIILEAKGVLPFEESADYIRWVEELKRDGKRAPSKSLAEFVQVEVFDGTVPAAGADASNPTDPRNAGELRAGVPAEGVMATLDRLYSLFGADMGMKKRGRGR